MQDPLETPPAVDLRSEVVNALLDVEQALQRLEGDEELFRLVLGVFLETLPELLDAVSGACAASNASALREAAHALKGAAAAVCAEAVRATAERLEELGRGGVLTGADALSTELREHADRLLATLARSRA